MYKLIQILDGRLRILWILIRLIVYFIPNNGLLKKKKQKIVSHWLITSKYVYRSEIQRGYDNI